jgi:Fur family ferric uptake transcriptional regulator
MWRMSTPTFDSLCERLQLSAYKITPQRQVILKTLLDNNWQHLSAEELYAIVKEEHPEIGLATVYRTLEICAGLDILQEIEFGDGCTRYEFAKGQAHRHHHLICVKCGKVTEFDDDFLETLEAWVSKKTGFKVADHQLKLYGYCEDCQRLDQTSTPSRTDGNRAASLESPLKKPLF